METLNGNHNILARPDKNDILQKVLETSVKSDNRPAYYGDGHASKKICALLKKVE